ncbi:metal-dependent amidase/aminoacylase/carboxypeptidase [Martensiomyces pterosporus]|nr:metal-dependent amidase/aminoacylase/carboxypeptidase [Martensiomyces pterosporus]
MLISVDDVISQTIDKASDELRELSLAIHDNPELSLKEERACKTLTDYFKDKGYQVEHNVAGLKTAFVVTYTSPAGSSGLNIGFCSEYDALPGIGHGCGHNLIAISGVAMFLAIRTVLDACKVPGTVKLFGTPAEEAIGGKNIMNKAKVFDGMDVLMMLHPAPGYSGAWHSQCCLSMVIEYFGKASHAAMAPWDGINAGTAANIAIQTIGVMREQLKPDWRTHGIITTGGQAANVIPEYSRIEYTIRTAWSDELETLRKRVLRAFEAAALATGCTHKVEEEFTYLDNLDNPVLGQMYEDIMEDKYNTPPGRGTGGSTDFGNLSHDFISLHGMFDLAGTGVPNHTVEFTKDARTPVAHEKTLFAAKTTARIAARCLVDGEFWERVKSAHDERKGSKDIKAFYRNYF